MKINIVLFQPEIPQNTANIMRTCVGLNATLHLIKPYGFDLNLSERVFKRNATNYVKEVELIEYDSFDHFLEGKDQNNVFFLTRYGKKIYSDIALEEKSVVYYVFGRESSGIDKDILDKFENQTFRIPMYNKMRSLNLANCVALVGYDGSRQMNFEGLENEEPHKINFWEKE